MPPDSWAALSAVLLALAVAARGAAVRLTQTLWGVLAMGARAAAAFALAVGLILSVASGDGGIALAAAFQPGGQPSGAFALGPVLALATLIVHLLLTWRIGLDAAAPVVDLVSLALILSGLLSASHPEPLPACRVSVPPLQIQGTLFLLGGGGLIVAGSVGLTLALRAAWQSIENRRASRVPAGTWSGRTERQALLRMATLFGLVGLAAGLLVGLWWSWRLTGGLTSAGSEQLWAASAWLVAAMSFLAWRTGERGGRWAAGLAVVAAAIIIVGLLGGMPLLQPSFE